MQTWPGQSSYITMCLWCGVISSESEVHCSVLSRFSYSPLSRFSLIGTVCVGTQTRQTELVSCLSFSAFNKLSDQTHTPLSSDNELIIVTLMTNEPVKDRRGAQGGPSTLTAPRTDFKQRLSKQIKVISYHICFRTRNTQLGLCLGQNEEVHCWTDRRRV